MHLVNLALLALSVSRVAGRYGEGHEANQKVLNIALEEPQYLIELMSGGTKWVTEAEKWQLRGVCISSSITKHALTIERKAKCSWISQIFVI